MNMRVHTLTTHLQAHEALTLIELIDQLREVFLQAYGDDIRDMLRQTGAPTASNPNCGEEALF